MFSNLWIASPAFPLLYRSVKSLTQCSLVVKVSQPSRVSPALKSSNSTRMCIFRIYIFRLSKTFPIILSTIPFPLRASSAFSIFYCRRASWSTIFSFFSKRSVSSSRSHSVWLSGVNSIYSPMSSTSTGWDDKFFQGTRISSLSIHPSYNSIGSLSR